MKILVVGSGARENAIVWKLTASPYVDMVYCAPGNGGTALLAQNLAMKATSEQECDLLAGWAFNNRIDLVIVGPELPLSQGLGDSLTLLGVPSMAPTKAAARIEWSKSWARDFMERHGIPSPGFCVLEGLDAITTHLQAADRTYPLVVKADGLAAGKGAAVAQNADEALEAVREMKIARILPEDDAEACVVVEEFLDGVEVSALAFTDGERVEMMPPSCDYKRLLDGDQGPMTGGMGAYSPTSLVSEDLWAHVKESIMERAVRGLAEEDTPFRGVLYAGLMLTSEGPKVLEFNCRLGDPEAQVLLPRLETPLEDIAQAIAVGDLSRVSPLKWSDEVTVGVVIATEAYPISATSPVPVSGLSDVEEGVLVFHASTELKGTTVIRPAEAPKPKGGGFFNSLFGGKQESATLPALDAQLYGSGGRVLTLVARGVDFQEARERLYRNISRVRFDGAQYRRDIGEREIVE